MEIGNVFRFKEEWKNAYIPGYQAAILEDDFQVINGYISVICSPHRILNNAENIIH